MNVLRKMAGVLLYDVESIIIIRPCREKGLVYLF